MRPASRSALSWYVQGLEERSGLKVRLSIPDNFGRLPPEMELLIFRLVQECLTNILRHSGSKTAQIEITREEERIHMAVQDEGGGMSSQRLAEIQSHGTGVGIRGMRERVRQFHGDLVIESNGSGTRVYACLPLKPYKGPGQYSPRGGVNCLQAGSRQRLRRIKQCSANATCPARS